MPTTADVAPVVQNLAGPNTNVGNSQPAVNTNPPDSTDNPLLLSTSPQAGDNGTVPATGTIVANDQPMMPAAMTTHIDGDNRGVTTYDAVPWD